VEVGRRLDRWKSTDISEEYVTSIRVEEETGLETEVFCYLFGVGFLL
jgi:hypothetical protein